MSSDTEQRFGLTMRGVDRDEPGLVRERDGTVWLVAPDGTRTQLPGGGGGGSFKLVRSDLITKDTPGLPITDPQPNVVVFSVANGDFAVGDVIVDIWADVSEFFDGPDNAVLHLFADSGDFNRIDLFAEPTDLAFDRVEDDWSGNTPGLSAADHGAGGDPYNLDVRTNLAHANGTYVRLLPATVLTDQLQITMALGNGTTWTQGQMRVWMVVASLEGGGGGGLEPPVVITGTDPGTSPLSVQGAPAQSEAIFRVDNDPGNDPRILVEAGGATTIFGEGDAGSDNSKLEVDYGLSIYDEDGTKIAVFEKGDITFTSGSVKVNGNGLPEVIRIPLAFDTPGLVITGREVYQPAPGDLIAHAFVWVSEEWDGTTPRFYIASAGTEASTGEIMYGPFNISDPPGYNDPAHHSASIHDLVQINGTGTILLDTTPVVAIVDNNATPSGDPGATQGALELILVIDRAA